ncbi:MAG: PH domain-containing protein [Lentisphaeria bacterium]|nr:PH domain-containing protein [Lentisphaeria bacterium]
MKTACPHCGQHYDVEDQYNNQTFPCPQCGKAFTIAPMVEIAPEQTSAAKDPGIVLQASPVYFFLTDLLFWGALVISAAVVTVLSLYFSEQAYIPVSVGIAALVVIAVSVHFAYILTKKTVYTLRSDRLEIVSGLITKDFRTVNIKDVQDIQASQSIVQLLLHCGNVYCYNKGIEIPFSLVNIPDHLRWKEEIEKRIR